MESTTHHRLLLIEDDPDVAEMLVTYFQSQKYDILHADAGLNGVEMARRHLPSIILLDVMMPDIDGYETCRRIRAMNLTRYIPIIFLTQRDDRSAKVKGLELGADDYITKPFDLDVLRLRVQGAIRRATRDNLHEPRTGLPTGAWVQEEIERRRFHEPAPALLRLVVSGWAEFADQYGFMMGNEALAFAARTIQQAVSTYGTSQDFIGFHDDQFVIVTAPEAAADIEAVIQQAFSAGIAAFYPYADAERGGLLLNEGVAGERLVPLMRLAAVQAA
jgi:DNA-binding response OmpR family regulator